MADRFEVFPEILARFAGDPIDPLGAVPRVAADENNPAYALLQAQLQAIDAEAVETEKLDRTFRFVHEGATGEGLERAARVWALIKRLQEAISVNRLSLLGAQDCLDRPSPYEEASVSDLPVRSDRLVPLSEFEIDGATLSRNGHAFMIAPTVDAQNASHWLTLALASTSRNDAWVRLDPFLHGPAGSLSRLFYKIWWYGRPLDWARVAKLCGEEHGRWGADEGERGDSRITEFVWRPVDGEVHFVCEELPMQTECDRRGARYLHAIYDVGRDVLTHLDGAIRRYTADELADRRRQHLRQSGKVGIRKKIFRCDGSITKEALSDLATTFFMWNWDVRQYFLAAPDAALASD